MAVVKIILDDGETIEEAQDSLRKALETHINAGGISELYEDDLANVMLDEAEAEVRELFKKMFTEIGTVLAEDLYGSKS